MPDPLEPRVAPSVQPSVDVPLSVTPQQLGAGIGESLGFAGEVATKIHADAVAQANQTAVMDADNQTQGFINQRVYDARTGVLNQNLGKDAPAAVDQTLADYDQHAGRVSASLANDQQKIAFQRMAQARRSDMEQRLGHYEHSETTRYANEVDQASIANAGTAAVQNVDRPDVAAQHLEVIRGVIASGGARNGLPPETIQAQQTDAVSRVQMGMLEQLVSTGQDQAASTWYADHKSDFNREDAPRAARLVEAGSTAGQVQRLSDEIMRPKDGLPPSGQAIQDRIDAIDNPKRRDEVQTRVDHAQERERRIAADSQKQAFTAAYNLANDDGNPQGIYHPKVVAAMALMSPEQQEYLRNTATKASRDPARTDELTTLAAKDPDAFLKSMQASPHLIAEVGRQDYAKLEGFVKEIKEKGSVASAAGIMTRAQAIDGALIAAGFAKEAKSSGLTEIDRNSPGAKAFIDAFDQRIRTTEQSTGRAMRPDEMKTLADHMVVDQVIQPQGSVYGYNKPVPAYALPADKRDTAMRDLAVYAKANPAEAAQIKDRIDGMAGKLGLSPGRLTADHYNQVFAQVVLAEEAKASGDQASLRRCVARANEILATVPKPALATSAADLGGRPSGAGIPAAVAPPIRRGY